MQKGAYALGLDTGHTLVHFGPRIYAWLLRALASWLAGRPAGAAGWLSDWLHDWLAGSLDSPGQFGFGTHFVFRGMLVYAPFLRYYRFNWCLERLLWAQNRKKRIGATLGPRLKPGCSGSWLVGWPAGRATGTAGRAADWLAEWLAGRLAPWTRLDRLALGPILYFPGSACF